jgi:hypothetical protein
MRRKCLYIMTAFFVLIKGPVAGQVIKDSVMRQRMNTSLTVAADSGQAKKDSSLTQPEAAAAFVPDLTNTFIYDFFTTANALYYENSQLEQEKNELNFYYNLTINNIFKAKYFTLRSYLFNEYGMRYFPDSIAIKGQDAFQIKNTLQIPVRKTLKVQVGITVKSQLWSTYDYRYIDSTQENQKYLYSSYFSPGYFIYSAGFTYNFLKNATLDIGLAGGKTTKIRNQRIFEDREVSRLYGLGRGEKKKVTYGVNLQLNVPPRKLNRNFGWECHAAIYADKEQLGRVKGYTADVMNVFHYIFLQNLRISLRTQILYDENVNEKVFMMNTISIGFYLSNNI